MSQITDIRLGSGKIYMNAVGDTWDPAWAADGFLFSPANDGSGWDKGCSNNMFFNRIAGEDPFTLHGGVVNCMADYGGWGVNGPDGCSWKTSGCISVDGVFYWVVARHNYGTTSGDPFERQTAQRASMIRSDDFGQTWTRSAEENYDHPMFPESRFATPYFIYYGQDGKAPDVDNAQQYIYAISNNGFWCNGDNYILGRVRREHLGRLDPSNWEFYRGGDGMLDESWSGSQEEAVLIIDNPLKCGETGATYLPAIGQYVLVAWYYPGNPNVETEETRFIYYEAPHPWGPWTQIKEDVIYPQGWYCPRVLSKWQQSTKDGEVDAVLVTGGDYYELEKYYRLTVVPISLRTDGIYPVPPPDPEPEVIAADAAGEGLNQFHYRGSWRRLRTNPGAPSGSEYTSNRPGDYFSIAFYGRRLKWFARKENNQGIASVSLDGEPEKLIDQWTYCHVPQHGRLLFDSGPLEPGAHTFRVQVTGQKNIKSTGTDIFNDRVEITE